MRTLYIHAGPSKTGTSAIQAALRHKAPTGLTYPKTAQWSDGAHHYVILSLAVDSPRGRTPLMTLPELRATLIAELDGVGGDVMLSSEGFTAKGSYPAFLTEYASLVAQFDRVIPIVVLRHPLERAASTYNQDVKDTGKGLAMMPDEFLQAARKKFSLMRLSRQWLRAEPNVMLLNYHPAKTLLARFSAALGFDKIEPPGRPERNTSLSGTALVAMLLGNRLDPEGSKRSKLWEALRADSNLRVFGGGSFPFSSAVAQRFLDECQKDLIMAKRNLGIDLTAMYPKPPTRFTLSEDDADNVRRHLEVLRPGAEDLARIETLIAEFRVTETD